MYITVNCDGDRSKAKVQWLGGVPGIIARWTSSCSGCTEYTDGQLSAGPFGCKECGYRGVRRHASWVPLTQPEMMQVFGKLIERASKERVNGKVSRTGASVC